MQMGMITRLHVIWVQIGRLCITPHDCWYTICTPLVPCKHLLPPHPANQLLCISPQAWGHTGPGKFEQRLSATYVANSFKGNTADLPMMLHLHGTAARCPSHLAITKMHWQTAVNTSIVLAAPFLASPRGNRCSCYHALGQLMAMTCKAGA